MGNIEAGEDGIGRLSITDEKIMLYGENSIYGRSCVCHAGVDDLGEDGIGRLSITDEKIMLYGKNSIYGRSCVCHAGVDDLGEGGHELSPTTG